MEIHSIRFGCILSWLLGVSFVHAEHTTFQFEAEVTRFGNPENIDIVPSLQVGRTIGGEFSFVAGPIDELLPDRPGTFFTNQRGRAIQQVSASFFLDDTVISTQETEIDLSDDVHIICDCLAGTSLSGPSDRVSLSSTNSSPLVSSNTEIDGINSYWRLNFESAFISSYSTAPPVEISLAELSIDTNDEIQELQSHKLPTPLDGLTLPAQSDRWNSFNYQRNLTVVLFNNEGNSISIHAIVSELRAVPEPKSVLLIFLCLVVSSVFRNSYYASCNARF